MGAVAVAVAGMGFLASAGAISSGPQAAGRLSPVRIYPGVRVAGAAKAAPGVGLTPDQIRAAYGLPPLSDLNGPGPLTGITGAHQTIVIVDSFGSPTIVHDLAEFDHTFAVPAPPSFRVIQPPARCRRFTPATATASAGRKRQHLTWNGRT